MSMERHPLVAHIVLNHKFAPPSADAHRFQSFLSAAHLPSHYDISARGPAVWDQGNLGSCTAHATLRCVEYAANQHADANHLPRPFHSRPSRLYEYANSRILEGTPLTEDSGATIEDAFKAVAKYSVPDETYWTYDPNHFFVKPPQAAYDAAHKFTHFASAAVPQTELAIKQAIFNGFPVAIGIQVYDSMMAEQCITTGIIPMPDTTKESLQGAHALTAVSFSDTERMFTLANSWNVTCGLPNKPGYFKIPYDYVLNPNLASDFWICKAFY